MKTFVSQLLIATLVAGFTANAVGQAGNDQGKQPVMPEMGAPLETKQLAGMVGLWKTHTKFKMDPSQPNWMESDGEARFEMGLDSCALIGHYSGPLMGMNFAGLSIVTFSRDLGKYQSYWVDNMGGVAGFYLGSRDKATGNIIYTGEDNYMGQKFQTKITCRTPDKKTFVMEFDQSTDGKTYGRTMDVLHTRQ